MAAYEFTVPLSLAAPRGAVPPGWADDFRASQVNGGFFLLLSPLCSPGRGQIACPALSRVVQYTAAHLRV